MQERMEEWVGIYGNRVTEDTERSWRSEAFAFITGFHPVERDRGNLGITAIGSSAVAGVG